MSNVITRILLRWKQGRGGGQSERQEDGTLKMEADTMGQKCQWPLDAGKTKVTNSLPEAPEFRLATVISAE